MTRKDITTAYQQFRKENNNRKPNRVIVRMHWEDEPENSLVDTIALRTYDIDAKDDAYILFYAPLSGLYALTKPDNGSDFIVDEILEFYKA